MRPTPAHRILSGLPWVVLGSGAACVCLTTAVLVAGPQSAARTVPAAAVKSLDSPKQAADALVDAAERFDVHVLEELFDPAYRDIVLSGEYAQDRQRAMEFVQAARQKMSIPVDKKSGSRAFLLIGNDD